MSNKYRLPYQVFYSKKEEERYISFLYIFLLSSILTISFGIEHVILCVLLSNMFVSYRLSNFMCLLVYWEANNFRASRGVFLFLLWIEGWIITLSKGSQKYILSQDTLIHSILSNPVRCIIFLYTLDLFLDVRLIFTSPNPQGQINTPCYLCKIISNIRNSVSYCATCSSTRDVRGLFMLNSQMQ
jgi:hypothetical protein